MAGPKLRDAATAPARRYLIVGNQTLGSPELATAVTERIASGPSDFYVVVPATRHHDLYESMINALEGHATTTQEARRDAHRRLVACLTMIRSHGSSANGAVGDPNPADAVAAALREREVDEIIVSTLPTHLSRWLKLDLPTRLASAFDIPVCHITAERPHAELDQPGHG